MKLFKIASRIGGWVYITLGLLTIGSILNGTLGLYINLIAGAFFLGIGYFILARAKNIIALLISIINSDNNGQITSTAVPRFILYENISALAIIFLGLILLSGGISRVFIEHMPIFG